MPESSDGPVFLHPEFQADFAPDTVALVFYKSHYDLVLPNYEAVEFQLFTSELVEELQGIPEMILDNMLACDEERELQVNKEVHDNIANNDSDSNADDRMHEVEDVQQSSLQPLDNEVTMGQVSPMDSRTEPDDAGFNAEEAGVSALEHVFVTGRATQNTTSIVDLLRSVQSKCFTGTQDYDPDLYEGSEETTMSTSEDSEEATEPVSKQVITPASGTRQWSRHSGRIFVPVEGERSLLCRFHWMQFQCANSWRIANFSSVRFQSCSCLDKDLTQS